MINISELIGDPDFAQPNGVTYIRRPCEVVNHKQQATEEQHTVTGIITIADDVSDELLPEMDVNTEYIHVFTYNKLYTTGRVDETATNGFLSDIVLWNGKRYKVMKVLNDEQYGFARATAACMQQEVI